MMAMVRVTVMIMMWTKYQHQLIDIYFRIREREYNLCTKASFMERDVSLETIWGLERLFRWFH